MKKIFIHCGLHKTGTTAIQNVFLRKAPILNRLGVLYPKTGRLDTLGGGHHSIAWEMARDRRYAPGFGGLAELIEEIRAFDGNVVLSSEDFESILHDQPRLAAMIARLRDCADEVQFVLYVRNQVAYCESLFLENLGQLIADGYDRYVEDATSQRRLRINDWVFQFDYLRLTEIFASLPARLVIRNFHALAGGSSVVDFLAVIGVDMTHFAGEAEHRSNERPLLFDALKGFCGNRFNRPLGDREVLALRMIGERAGARQPGTSAAARSAFRKGFAAGNRTLCRRLGLPEAGLDIAVETPSTNLSFEALFSFELQCAVLRMRDLLRFDKREAAAQHAAAFIAAASGQVSRPDLLPAPATAPRRLASL